MFKHYFKTAWRNLKYRKSFSIINIGGLAIGLSAVILIVIWIQNELSYDRFNKHAENTYRVTREFLNADGSTNIHLATIALPYAPLIKENFPEVEKVTRFLKDDNLIRYNEIKFTEHNIIWSDENFFNVFSFKFIKGSSQTALVNPNTVVITKDMAKKYFGRDDVLNRTIFYGEKRVPLKVTGVIENIPDNSHFHFDLAISFITIRQFIPKEDFVSDWGGNNYFTYVLLKPNADPAAIEAAFPKFLDKVMPAYGGVPGGKNNKLHLQKLTDIHLHSNLQAEAEPTGSIKYVYIFGCIAFFILLIACINYINLTTALASKRLKEVGVRKVIGAMRKQLFYQFFIESLLIILIALSLAVMAVFLFLPVFQRFNHTVYTFTRQQFFMLCGYIFVLLMLTAFLAGGYPSLYISAFKPIAILKNKFRINSTKISLRKTLVVFQFTISIFLITAVLIISRQVHYMQNADIGFNKNWIITLPSNDSIRRNFETIKNTLLRNTNIESATFSSRIPSGELLDEQGCSLETNRGMQQIDFRLANITTDFDYMKTFRMQMVAGRDFSKDFPTDSISSFIVNEAAVRAAGWKSNETAINKQIEYGGNKGRIVGVVKDFNFESLDKPIIPIVFYINPQGRRTFSVRLTGKNLTATIDYIKSVWQQFSPDADFSYTFLDNRLRDLYKAERTLNSIYILFAGIAIFIACLGLFGLATFTAEQRTKEIGIRKVFGASVGSIMLFISKDLLKPVMIATVIALPVGYFIMKKWLQNFAYHTALHWWLFAIAALITFVIALLTVLSKALKAARANPVKSLKTE